MATFEPVEAHGVEGDALPGHDVDLVWRCADCGYQRLSADAPDRCAACGAPAERLVGRTSIEWRFLLRHREGH